jgi:hypothetical protein
MGTRPVSIPPIRWPTAALPVQPAMPRALQPKSTKIAIPPVRFPQAPGSVPRHAGTNRPAQPVPVQMKTGRGVQTPPLAPVRGTAAPGHAKPHGVVQRMMEVEEKSPWRHLDTAPTSPNWQHHDNPIPLVQIAVGRYVVNLLRINGIQARLGGSVAALGYCTTRVPDDVDIYILPSHKHIDIANLELEQAKKLVKNNLVGNLFDCQAGVFKAYRVRAVDEAPSSTYVKALKIGGEFAGAPYDPENQKVEQYDPLILGIDKRVYFFTLQIVNETAFTFMNLPKDPGTIEEEKYKEVTGFARLVANCIGRLIQNGGQDLKGDRQRIKEMLAAKIASSSEEKVKRLCSKVLFYFQEAHTSQQAAHLLADIAHEIKPSIDLQHFEETLLTTFKVTTSLRELQKTGFFSTFSSQS